MLVYHRLFEDSSTFASRHIITPFNRSDVIAEIVQERIGLVRRRHTSEQPPKAFDGQQFRGRATATSLIDVGKILKFEDDGPAIDLTLIATKLVVDESVGTGGSVQNEPGEATNNDETAASAPALSIGFATIAAGSLFTEVADAGEDGQKSVHPRDQGAAQKRESECEKDRCRPHPPCPASTPLGRFERGGGGHDEQADDRGIQHPHRYHHDLHLRETS